MRKQFILFYLLLMTLSLAAQTREISGTVTDSQTGEALIGVNVVLTEQNTGTVTDLDGHFKLNAPENSTLQISYIGYKPQQIAVKGQSTINVKLAQESELIDELVVVGYAVQKKRDVLGAISKIDAKELTAIPVASAQQALQGRIAGVQVAAQTGAPGSNVSVRIRGVGSISSSNDPLYIVDGIPVEGALNNLSPNEIENMTVLKDASSAAIYGSRANNGVVLITTKSGKAGKAKISYNTQMGFQAHGKLTEMCNTAQYIELYNEAATNDNKTAVVKRELIQGSYLDGLADVNHLQEIFRIAPLQQHELSISGGNDKTQYLISGSYYGQKGILNNTDYQRGSLRSNINSEIKKWLTVGLNAQGGYAFNRMVSSSGDGLVDEGGSVVRYALFRNPAIPVYNANGTYVDKPSEYYGNSLYDSFFGDGYSPEGLAANTDRTRRTKTLLVSGNAVVKFPYDLIWKTTFGLDYKDAELRVYNPTWGTLDRINSTNSLSVSKTDEFVWTINSALSHNILIKGQHSLSSMVGLEAIRSVAHGFDASESHFVNTDPNFIYLGKGDSQRNLYQSESGYSLMSFFASVNYNYAQKYYLSAIVREDGSSRFSKGNRWGTFYSVSAGWNMESEDFMANATAINKLKLRAGYGAIGNQNIGLYAYSDRYSSKYYYTFGGNSYNGYAQTKLGNIDLKWETSNQFNAGVDLELLKGSIGVTLDYYYKMTNNMLVEASLPASVGNATAPWINSGSVLNTGVDLELFYRKDYKKGGFDIRLNGGFLHNKVKKLNAPIVGGRVDTGIFATRTEEGQPIGAFYLYEMDGIFQNSMEVLTSAYQGKGIVPGDVKYVDQNGDNVIDANDRKYMGSAIPTVTTGLTLSGYYKGFDLSLFFQGAFGQKIYSQVNHDIEGFYRGFNVTKRYYDERWTGEGTSNTQPRAAWAGKSNNVRASSRFLEDGSYFRLKNVQLGYTIPNTKKVGIENVRVYVAATNLFTITGYSGLDPEMTVSTNSAAEGDRANGIDWGTYPVARSFTFGLNFTF